MLLTEAVECVVSLLLREPSFFPLDRVLPAALLLLGSALCVSGAQISDGLRLAAWAAACDALSKSGSCARLAARAAAEASFPPAASVDGTVPSRTVLSSQEMVEDVALGVARMMEAFLVRGLAH